MSWYYSENNERLGPVDESAFQSLVAQGRIAPETLVWREGMSNWLPYSQVAGVSAATAPVSAGAGAAAPCAECSRTFPVDEMVSYESRYICPQCKPIFFQKVKEGAVITGHRVYAGFWKRFCAAVVDGIILVIGQYLIAMLLGLVGVTISANMDMFLSFFFGFAYEAYFTGRSGATPGKMALKLRVIRADGSPVGYGLSIGRYFGKILSFLILLIGYIMAAFDEEKRALHDRICDTRVVQE